MAYKTCLHPKADGFLRKLDKNLKERIKNKIKELESFPEKGKHLKYFVFWSLRTGDYRTIYKIGQNKNKIIILFIGHKKNVYDDFSKLF